jgi:hypothetical protein
MHRRYLAVGAILFLAGLTAFSACVNPRIGYAPEQPIAFSHKLHAGNQDIECKYCHTEVAKGPKASLPGLNTCMNCHTQIAGSDRQAKREINKIKEAYREGEPVKWVKVHDMPDHVQFSHQPHILRGVPCQECHGNVTDPKNWLGPGESEGQTSVPRVGVEKPFNMGWCIDCHRNNQYKKAPVDCTACHY